MTLYPLPVRGNFTAVVLLSAVMLGHLATSAQAGPPMSPDARLDVLAGLLDEDSGGLNTDKLEPPGSEEYLNALGDRLRGLLDDELEFCVRIGLLSNKGVRIPNPDGPDRFEESVRNTMIAEAESSGAKPRRKQSGRSAKLASVAKRWRRGQEKINGILDAKPNDKDLKRLISNSYDESKLGPIDASGLFRLRQNLQAYKESLNLAGTYFLAPVKAKIQNIQSVEDWRLVSHKAREFGKEVKTGPDSKKLIEEIIQDIELVGADNAFSKVPDDAKQYELEGYFLFSRQGLTKTDDVTDTVALVKGEELDAPAQTVRQLLADYARVREFRIKRMTDKVLRYQGAQITAESLFPEVGPILEEQDDPDERLRALQKLFGAPLGSRTRTKNSKVIEWVGTLTNVTEDRQAELRVDPGIEGQAPYAVVFDVTKTPLGEQALYGRLKLGREVVLVAKVRKLEYASDEAKALRFTVRPLLEDERGSKSSQDDVARKDSRGQPRKRRGRSKALGL
ncbi:MAG: hypothetical protein ACE5GE_04680 [Phycisphaerae bacterium]